MLLMITALVIAFSSLLLLWVATMRYVNATIDRFLNTVDRFLAALTGATGWRVLLGLAIGLAFLIYCAIA